MNIDELKELITKTINEKDPIKAIAQALGDGGPGTVVGEMGKRGFHFELRQNPLLTNPFICSWFNSGERVSQCIDKTPALAFSRAAASALGIKLEG